METLRKELTLCGGDLLSLFFEFVTADKDNLSSKS